MHWEVGRNQSELKHEIQKEEMYQGQSGASKAETVTTVQEFLLSRTVLVAD